MNLITLIEIPVKHWGKAIKTAPEVNELRIKEPNAFEIEQAIARAKINDIDTIIVYK